MFRPTVGLLIAGTLLLASCGGDPEDEADEGPATAPTTATTTEVVEGTYDVGGHSLYLRCEGTGSPTVVYMHGSIDDSATVAHNGGTGFQRLLAEDYRTCVYDRRNVGDSDTVDAVQLPADATGEMDRLLDEAGIAPPYVLVGASFGGMLAYLYANEHPDEVVGMVLLDAMFPDELALEHLFPPEDRYEAYSEDDETNGLERISHFKVITAGQQYIGKEPAIPVTLPGLEHQGGDGQRLRHPRVRRRILELQRRTSTASRRARASSRRSALHGSGYARADRGGGPRMRRSAEPRAGDG